jgi:hypothetical protein
MLLKGKPMTPKSCRIAQKREESSEAKIFCAAMLRTRSSGQSLVTGRIKKEKELGKKKNQNHLLAFALQSPNCPYRSIPAGIL